MSRLTEKKKRIDYFTGLEFNYQTDDLYAIDKLGKLEDLQDELGCPLDVVTSKTAMVVKNDSILEMNIMAIGFNDGTIYFGSSWNFITKKLKDYKKTWWLSSDLEE